MAIPDPTEEIKAIRHRLGAAFDYDLERIVADIQRQANRIWRQVRELATPQDRKEPRDAHRVAEPIALAQQIKLGDRVIPGVRPHLALQAHGQTESKCMT